MIKLDKNPGGPGPIIQYEENDDNPPPYCLDVLLFTAIYFTVVFTICFIAIVSFYVNLD